MQPDLPSFAELRRRYDAADEDPPLTALSHLPPNRSPDEVLGRLVIDYLSSLGLAVADLDQLHDTIRRLEDEELSAFRVREGLAVSAASDGWWVLFVEEGQV